MSYPPSLSARMTRLLNAQAKLHKEMRAIQLRLDDAEVQLRLLQAEYRAEQRSQRQPAACEVRA